MQQSEEMSSEAKEELKEAVDGSLGVSEEQENEKVPDPAAKKLGMQEKRHKKEMRKMQQQLDELRSHLGSRPEPQHSPENMGAYNSQPEMSENLNPQIYAAVQKALQMEKDREHVQHIHKQYESLKSHLDSASEKYDDFDDVVKSDDAPYTETMKGIATVIHGIPGLDASETLYHLGKDRNKLHKLSQLPPIEQSREVLKMAMSLMNSSNKPNANNESKPLGQIKNNPVHSKYVNENTPASEIRRRMKSGEKKWAS